MESIQNVMVSVQEIRTEKKKNNLMAWLMVDIVRNSPLKTTEVVNKEKNLEKKILRRFLSLLFLPEDIGLGHAIFFHKSPEMSSVGQNMVLITPRLWF